MTREKAKSIIQEWLVLAGAHRRYADTCKNTGQQERARVYLEKAEIYEHCADDIDRAFGRLS